MYVCAIVRKIKTEKLSTLKFFFFFSLTQKFKCVFELFETSFRNVPSDVTHIKQAQCEEMLGIISRADRGTEAGETSAEWLRRCSGFGGLLHLSPYQSLDYSARFREVWEGKSEAGRLTTAQHFFFI